MNGETVCSSHPVTVLSCAKSLSLVHDDKTISLMQEGRHSPINSQENDAQRLEAGRRPKAVSMTTKDSKADFPETENTLSQCSPGWSDEQPSAQQHRCPQSSVLSTPVAPLVFSNSLSHSLLHNNNNNNSTSHHGRQRRGVHHREKRPTLKTATKKNLQNRKVTDYYPIRRSSRKSKTELKFEQKKLLDDLITNGIEEGMEVQQIEGKGRAVFATRHFQKGEYVVEYHGDLLQITDAKKREAEYAQNPATGCYMYYFQYLCKTYCVDATKETGRMGRLINHSKNGNCQTKLHDINGVPHLILVASRNIDQGEELLYDYGDRSKASIAAHPWLKD